MVLNRKHWVAIVQNIICKNSKIFLSKSVSNFDYLPTLLSNSSIRNSKVVTTCYFSIILHSSGVTYCALTQVMCLLTRSERSIDP